MKFKIQILVENDEGDEILLAEHIEFERRKSSLENLGLSLAESKELLRETQQTMVKKQVREFLRQSATCPHCVRKRLSKGTRRLVYRTLFGKMEIDSPRLFYCGCELEKELPETKTFSPLAIALPERTSPELFYSESKFSSQISFDLSRRLLSEVLPLHEQFNAATMRNHLHKVGERLESELPDEKMFFVEGCPRDWASLPRKQQMRWTKRGAHLLLQVSVKVLNEELQENFREWYPQFEVKKAADSVNSKKLALAV